MRRLFRERTNMTDVVKIARQCRTELAKEIAKLDEFIQMADKLLEYEKKGADKMPDPRALLAGKETGAVKASLRSMAEAANGTGAQS